MNRYPTKYYKIEHPSTINIYHGCDQDIVGVELDREEVFRTIRALFEFLEDAKTKEEKFLIQFAGKLVEDNP